MFSLLNNDKSVMLIKKIKNVLNKNKGIDIKNFTSSNLPRLKYSNKLLKTAEIKSRIIGFLLMNIFFNHITSQSILYHILTMS